MKTLIPLSLALIALVGCTKAPVAVVTAPKPIVVRTAPVEYHDGGDPGAREWRACSAHGGGAVVQDRRHH